MAAEGLQDGVRSALDAAGVAYEVLDCDPELADTAAFCAAYDIAPADCANTIVVRTKGDRPLHVACVVLATTRLDVNGCVRRRLGVRKASFAPTEETTALTGMLVGGVTVFGLPADWPVWIDARVLDRDEVILGAGGRAAKVRTPPASLLRLPQAEVVEGLALDLG